MSWKLNVHRIQWQNYLSLKGFEPATSCIRDQDATTAPARHMWKTVSLNWAQFMLQWFIKFPEFTEITEFNESSAPFRKNSLWRLSVTLRTVLLLGTLFTGQNYSRTWGNPSCATTRSTMAWQPRTDVTWSPKNGVPVAPEKEWCHTKKKQSQQSYFHTIYLYFYFIYRSFVRPLVIISPSDSFNFACKQVIRDFP